MDRVSLTSSGAVWQARQKQTGSLSSAAKNSPVVTFRGDSFYSIQKSAPHFAGGKGKGVERATDGEKSTLYDGYYLWQGNYLTTDEWKAQKAKNEAIWNTLMANPAPSTTQSAAHEPSESSTQEYIQYKGVYLTPEEYQREKAKDDAIWDRLMAGPTEETQEEQSGYPTGLEDFSGLSIEDQTATGSQLVQTYKGKNSLQRGVSVLKPDEKEGPRCSVSPIQEEGYETEDGEESTKNPGHIKWGQNYLTPDEYQSQLDEYRLQQEAEKRQKQARLEGRGPGSIKQPKAQHPRRLGQAITQTILEEGYESDTQVGDFLPDVSGIGWWQKVRKGNRDQLGVYQPYTQQAEPSTKQGKKGGFLGFLKKKN